jgi:hypothetical protein
MHLAERNSFNKAWLRLVLLVVGMLALGGLAAGQANAPRFRVVALAEHGESTSHLWMPPRCGSQNGHREQFHGGLH